MKQKIQIVFGLFLLMAGGALAAISDPTAESSLVGNSTFNPNGQSKTSEALTLQSSGPFRAESYNRMVELVSTRTGVSDSTRASTLNSDVVINPGLSNKNSAPLVLKNHGDLLTAEEFNRLLEAASQLEYTEGPWTTSSWGSCSATCGNGIQTRTVTCDYDQCTGAEPSDTQSCSAGSNTCGWSSWGSWTGWSGCSASCGGGTQTRTRTRTTRARTAR